MTPKLKHWFFDHHLLVTFVLLLLVFVMWASVDTLRTWNFLYPAIGSVLSLSYFVLKLHLEEIRLFRGLFLTFNNRYNAMHMRLYALCDAPAEQELTSDEITLLYNYFNLCAEEYLYYRKGFIYPEVWFAWCNGMKIFCGSPRICALWKKELQTNSYYGFPIPCC